MESWSGDALSATTRMYWKAMFLVGLSMRSLLSSRKCVATNVAGGGSKFLSKYEMAEARSDKPSALDVPLPNSSTSRRLRVVACRSAFPICVRSLMNALCCSG